MPQPIPVIPNVGQESVWDYPCPPRVEKSSKRIQVIFNDVVIADSTDAIRVLEKGHPPVYYVPTKDIGMKYLRPTSGGSKCRWKGCASFFDLVVGNRCQTRVAWTFRRTGRPFSPIQDYVAFFAGPMDACYVDDEQVTAQPGQFFGGWITKDIVGPFKGEPGSADW